MREAGLEESEIGVKIAETTHNNNSKGRWKDGNIKKTKIMSTAGSGVTEVTINGKEVERVKDFCFLGSITDQTGNCTAFH